MLKCFNQIREYENVHKPNFRLGCPALEVSLDDNLECTISPRFDALVDTPLTKLGVKIDLHLSSLSNIPSKPSNTRDVIDNLFNRLIHLFLYPAL